MQKTPPVGGLAGRLERLVGANRKLGKIVGLAGQEIRVVNGETATASDALASVAKRAATKAVGWNLVISILQLFKVSIGRWTDPPS